MRLHAAPLSITMMELINLISKIITLEEGGAYFGLQCGEPRLWMLGPVTLDL